MNLVADLEIFEQTVLFNTPITAVDIDKKIAFRILALDGKFLPSSSQNDLLNQQQLFAECGWKIIQIFEDELLNNYPIVLSRCLHTLHKTRIAIPARKCRIVAVSSKEARKFFNENHIQGCGRGASIFAGLIFNNQLVSCISFGKARFNPTARYELIRFASILDTCVVGGASRLMTYSQKNLLDTGSIISYADKRYGNGDVYLKSGFKKLAMSAPCYWYYKKDDKTKKYHRSSFQKHKLHKKLEIFDPIKTELVNMQINGWSRIYDAGNDVYILND